EMNAIDLNCEYFGLSRLQLMENAGAQIASEIKRRFSSPKKITIIAGRGNNGGDAFVAARHLKDFEVEVILLGSAKDIKTEQAKRNWDILKNIGSITLREIRDSKDLSPINSDIIIDAIFGTGIRGVIRSPESEAIDLINNSKSFIVSVDVPSGFDPDGIQVPNKAVHSDLTVTFHKTKVGLTKDLAKEYTKDISVVDIGIPAGAEYWLGPGDLKLLKTRKKESHKGNNGRVLIIGGGAYTGAPALSAIAALRVGVDIATLATPKSVSDVIASFSPNLIVWRKQLSSEFLNREDIPTLVELIASHDVVVIGMGLGRARETLEAVKEILESNLCKKLVIDADALHALKGSLPLHSDAIITPHRGEFKKLSDIDLPENLKEKAEIVKEFSRKNKIVTLLKGPIDIISDGSLVKMNQTGNSAMTVGGTGDVLAGIVGALFCNNDALISACSAAFINGTAGDLAFEEFGYSLIATDVIEKIAKVLK
ncbi:MAG: NAD(P)H-hydrate dehydratase, partial [Methanosarcinales archaeon]